MDARQELLLLQICDSVFPIGAYSHSYGLETYIQLGIVHDEATTGEFVASQIRWPFTYTELLGMRLAYDAAAAGDLARLAELEASMAATRVPSETREASRKMAARFCKMAPTLLGGTGAGIHEQPGFSCTSLHVCGPGDVCPEPYPQGTADLFAAYAGTGSHMVNAAYGVFAACAGIDREELLRRYLYSQVSAMVTNCVKTVPLSQTAGQRLLLESASLQVEAVAVALGAPAELLGLSMPGFDVRQIEHETLYSRLYMS